MNVRSSLLLLGSWLMACSRPAPAPEVAEPGAPPELAPVQVQSLPAAPSAAASVAPPAKVQSAPPAPSPGPVLTYQGAFATPESVLHDAVADRYLVSNINGKPDGVDGNGYISELLPDGTIKTPKLLAGGEKGVALDAPKGMAIVRGELWVSDITQLRRFDLKTLAPKGSIALPGATFANDVVAAPDGRVFVSDSSIKPSASGFEPQGGDQVLVVDQAGKVKVVAKAKELAGPNGLFFGAKGLYVNALNSNELFRLTEDGKRHDVQQLPGGGLDGLHIDGDTVLVSSWGASAVYRGKLGGAFEPIVQNVSGPADFAWDKKRSRVVLPRFLNDVVEVYEVK